MSIIKRIVIAVVILTIGIILCAIPEPIPVIDEFLITLATIGGIGAQIRGISLKENK